MLVFTGSWIRSRCLSTAHARRVAAGRTCPPAHALRPGGATGAAALLAASHAPSLSHHMAHRMSMHLLKQDNCADAWLRTKNLTSQERCHLGTGASEHLGTEVHTSVQPRWLCGDRQTFAGRVPHRCRGPHSPERTAHRRTGRAWGPAAHEDSRSGAGGCVMTSTRLHSLVAREPVATLHTTSRRGRPGISAGAMAASPRAGATCATARGRPRPAWTSIW